MLTFLIVECDRDGHLSVPAAGGRGQGDRTIGDNQQPIEVAAIADACDTAYQATGDPFWRLWVHRCWKWFLGDNDRDTCMIDPNSGGSYDGLFRAGPNLNQGAESTIAMLSTRQQALRLGFPMRLRVPL
jgi:hypothetical protein